jgi:hypothetical protein
MKALRADAAEIVHARSLVRLKSADLQDESRVGIRDMTAGRLLLHTATVHTEI